jgi:hypothetical protein
MKNVAFLWAILAVSIGLAQDKPSMVGTWKLDIAQSDFGSDPAPKSMVGTITKETPQTFAFHAHGIDDKGKPFAYSWSGPEDGSMHPIMFAGKPIGQANAQKQPDGSIKRSGKEPDGAFESHVVLSPDGNTFTEEMTEKSPDGKVVHQKVVFHRAGAAKGKPSS